MSQKKKLINKESKDRKIKSNFKKEEEPKIKELEK